MPVPCRIALLVTVLSARFLSPMTGSQVPGKEIYTANRSYSPMLALSDFLEARWNRLGVSISYAAPRNCGNTYDVKVSDFSVNIGYTFHF